MSSKLEENKRIARRFPEEVANTGDLAVIDEICAEDILDHGTFGDVRGREELKAQAEMLLSAFGDFSATVEDVIAQDDTVAMRLTLRGTHEGELRGIPPTGRQFEQSNMVISRIEDGRIVERWIQPDMFGLMQQLGIIEPSGA